MQLKTHLYRENMNQPRLTTASRSVIEITALEELLHDGKQEGGRLATSGLGASHQIRTSHNERNSVALDGSGLRVASLVDVLADLGREIDLIEGTASIYISSHFPLHLHDFLVRVHGRVATTSDLHLRVEELVEHDALLDAVLNEERLDFGVFRNIPKPN